MHHVSHVSYIHIVTWLVVWNIFYFPIYWESHHPHWLSYFSEGWPNHQPVMILFALEDLIEWKGRIGFTVFILPRGPSGVLRVDRQVKANRYVRDYHEQWTRVVDALHLPYSCTTCRDVGNNPKFVWSDLLCFMVNQTSIFRLVMVKSSLFGMFHDYLIAFRPIFDGWIVPCMAYISCPSRPLFSRQLRALQMRLQLLGERRELLSEEGKGQAGADGGPRGKASIDEVYMRSSQQPRTRLFFSVIYRTSSLMFFFF